MALLLRSWIMDCMRSFFTAPHRSRLSTVAFTMSMQNFLMLFGRNLIPVYLSKLFAEYKFSLKLRIRSENKTIIELEKFDIQKFHQLLFPGWVWCVKIFELFGRFDKSSRGHGYRDCKMWEHCEFEAFFGALPSDFQFLNVRLHIGIFSEYFF